MLVKEKKYYKKQLVIEYVSMNVTLVCIIVNKKNV